MSTMQQKDPFALKPGCCLEPGTDKKVPAVKVPRDYQPPDSWPYEVEDEDSWLSLCGDKLDVARKLIKFNFNTNHPPYVNWYLRNYVGCTWRTVDEFNYRFSSNDKNNKVSKRAGIIYFPNTPILGDELQAGPIGGNSQNVTFQSHFYAESLLADEIEAILIAAELGITGGAGHTMKKKFARWVRNAGSTVGKIGAKVLGAIGAVYQCRGVLVCEVEGAEGSMFAWTFGGYLVGKNIPFFGDGPHYSTNTSKPVRYNLNVLEPRREWVGKEISFTLGRSSAALRVYRALQQRISDDYRPFPNYETNSTDVTISMPLVGVGPIGLATTPPGLWMNLKPFGRLADISAADLVLKIFSKEFEY